MEPVRHKLRIVQVEKLTQPLDFSQSLIVSRKNGLFRRVGDCSSQNHSHTSLWIHRYPSIRYCITMPVSMKQVIGTFFLLPIPSTHRMRCARAVVGRRLSFERVLVCVCTHTHAHTRIAHVQSMLSAGKRLRPAYLQGSE